MTSADSSQTKDDLVRPMIDRERDLKGATPELLERIAALES